MAKKRKKSSRKVARKKVTKKKRGARGRKKATRKAGRPRRNLSDVSTTALEAELERRASQVDELLEERDQLASRLSEIDDMLAALKVSTGPVTRTGGRRRPRNKQNLADSLAGVLKGRELSVTELTEAVQKAGYKTSSPNFRTIVNQTLIKDPKRFKKVSRGVYTVD